MNTPAIVKEGADGAMAPTNQTPTGGWCYHTSLALPITGTCKRWAATAGWRLLQAAALQRLRSWLPSAGDGCCWVILAGVCQYKLQHVTKHSPSACLYAQILDSSTPARQNG
jgi:hypothetical protein